MAGSTMTLSPFFKTRIVIFVWRYCSATNGLTFDLMPPVPSPMIPYKLYPRLSVILKSHLRETLTIDTIKPLKAAPCSIAQGKDVQNSMNTPTI